MTNKEVALEFAKTNGFVSVSLQEEWNGFDVYVAMSKESNIIEGYPFFILVNKEGIARESTIEELYSIMGFKEAPLDATESIL